MFGPRQVGKTTLLKLLVKRLLDNGVEPRAIFYFRCDQLADYKELELVLEEYFKMRKLEGLDTAYIFLDEITFPGEWYRTIKLWIDMGRFQNDVLILTGSLSMYAKREVESFPGRRGKGRDFIMYPLSFREFVSIADRRLGAKLEAFEKLEADEILSKSIRLYPWLSELNRLLELYLTCGGFPLSVRPLLEHGRILENVKRTYLSWIRGDLAKLRMNEIILKKVMKAVIDRASSTLTWNSVAKEFEIKSHKTVFNYIDLLERLFLMKILYYVEPSKGVLNYVKAKKIHLTDPFLYIVFSEWCFTRKPLENAIIESIVASHLARKHPVAY